MIRYGFLSLNTGFASCSSLKAYSQVRPEDGGKRHQVEQQSFQVISCFPNARVDCLLICGIALLLIPHTPLWVRGADLLIRA